MFVACYLVVVCCTSCVVVVVCCCVTLLVFCLSRAPCSLLHVVGVVCQARFVVFLCVACHVSINNVCCVLLV